MAEARERMKGKGRLWTHDGKSRRGGAGRGVMHWNCGSGRGRIEISGIAKGVHAWAAVKGRERLGGVGTRHYTVLSCISAWKGYIWPVEVAAWNRMGAARSHVHEHRAETFVVESISVKKRCANLVDAPDMGWRCRTLSSDDVARNMGSKNVGSFRGEVAGSRIYCVG